MAEVTREQLIDALAVALDDQIWMSGADAFDRDGEAYAGWVKAHQRLAANLHLLRRARETEAAAA